MLNFIFVITMLGFALFVSVLIIGAIIFVFNAILEKATGITISDIFDYAISRMEQKENRPI